MYLFFSIYWYRFYSQLGVLFSSGIDLGTALKIIIDDEPSQKCRKYFQSVFDDVLTGLSFSEALRSTGQFSDYEYYSVKVGEESGRLQEVLKELTDFFELRIQQRRQLTGALSYSIYYGNDSCYRSGYIYAECCCPDVCRCFSTIWRGAAYYYTKSTRIIGLVFQSPFGYSYSHHWDYFFNCLFQALQLV